MTSPGSKQTRRWERAIAALLAEPTIGQAAKAAGISDKTLRRWLKEPAFSAEYRAARRQAVDHALTILRQMAGEAVETLRRNLGPSVPESVQVRAALAILDLALKADMQAL